MNDFIVAVVTIIVTWIMGTISKKYTNLSNKIIPLQNLLIGIIVATIDFIITKDFNTAIAVSGLTAGGMYDILHNYNKLKEEEW